jgi:hypothetical protein
MAPWFNRQPSDSPYINKGAALMASQRAPLTCGPLMLPRPAEVDVTPVTEFACRIEATR